MDDKRKALIDKYPAPENLAILSPPFLNPEVKNAINNPVLKRDERLALLQKQIDAALTAIGLAVTSLLQEEGRQKHDLLQLLGDAGRLLADMHFLETKSRRELVLLNLDQQLKEALISAPVTNQLFGDSLDERVNTAKNLKKFSQGLKPPNKPVPTVAKKVTNASRPLNYRGLSRQVQGYHQGRRPNNQSPYTHNKQRGLQYANNKGQYKRPQPRMPRKDHH